MDTTRQNELREMCREASTGALMYEDREDREDFGTVSIGERGPIIARFVGDHARADAALFVNAGEALVDCLDALAERDARIAELTKALEQAAKSMRTECLALVFDAINTAKEQGTDTDVLWALRDAVAKASPEIAVSRARALLAKGAAR